MSDLQAFLADERFTTLDRSLARHLAAQASSSRWIGHAAALLSSVLRRGHLCLDLSQRPSDHFEAAAALQPWPSLTSWRDDLLASGLVGRGDGKHLVLHAADHAPPLWRIRTVEKPGWGVIVPGVESGLLIMRI